MIVLGILVSIAAIGTMCWLLFNLAVFALPFFMGLNAGTWAYGTGAGWLGAILIGLLAAGLTLAVGQGLLMLILFGVSAFGTDLGLRIMEGLGLVAVT